MPQCRHCGRVQATVEMRRTPKGDHVCKDKHGCAAAIRERAAA